MGDQGVGLNRLGFGVRGEELGVRMCDLGHETVVIGEGVARLA